MKVGSLFWLSLISGVVSAVVCTAGWRWNDHEATLGDNLLRQGQLDPYDYDQGWIGHDGVEHAGVPDSRARSDDYFFLLKIVPASIVAFCFVASWIAWGPAAFRLQTLKSHFSSVK